MVPPPKPKDTTRQQKGGLVINLKNLHISNGVFANEKENFERGIYPDMFDSDHIRFGEINADFENLHFENAVLTTNINLSTKERSGFEVKKLQANMKFSGEIMEFNNLDLQTNKSRLGNYYSMRYDDFDEDMGHFLHKIKLEGNFINSELNSDDLAFFTKDVKDWKRIFSIGGHVKGTVDNLIGKKMLIKSGNSAVDGDITMKGLPDIENTFIDFTAKNLQTTYNDLTSIIPSLKNVDQPKLNRLGNINYKGNFTGFINDFVAFGTISTDLGTVTGDLNLKLPQNKPAIYSGKISTLGFRLGQFVDNSTIGSITFNGKVNGSGFSGETLNAKFDGDVRNIEYDGYNFQNITVNGTFKKKLFNGLASINDPNLKVDQLTGIIDFNGKEPQFDFDALLAKADFKKLGFTKDEFILKGHFNLNFTGDNIDNFLGTAHIMDAGLLHNGVPLSFDSLVLTSQIVGEQKYLSLQSNEVDANVTGNFKIQELPDAFKVFLSRYYPAYIKKPGYQVSEQDFTFEVKTKIIDEYIQLIDKKLKGFDNSTVSGNLKLKNNELNVNAEVPAFSYDGKVFNNVRLQSKGNFDSLATKVDVEDVAISDSLHLPFTNLVINSSKDSSNISIKTSASKTISDASVNARVVTMNNGVKVHFFPSSFIINDSKWELEKDGEIELNNSLVSASDVKFVQGNQQIKISTEPSETLSTNDLIVELTKVHVDDFATLAIKEPKLEGQVTGIIKIEDPFGKPFIHYETNIDEFKADNDSIGTVKANGTYNIKDGILTVKAASTNENNQLDINGIINFKDSTGTQTNILIQSKKFDLSLLNSFLGDLFSDVKGTANTTDFTLSNNGKNLLFTGTVNVNEASLVVNYTQCKYKFKNESIVFNPDEIDFGKIELKDTLGNKATLSGKMYHRFFNDIEFDNIALETDRLLVLNTTKKDNSQFYGKVVGKAKMFLNGTQDNIVMNITGEPSRRDSSHIYIVSGNSIENENIDYIDFIQFGTEMEEKYKSKTAASILVNMEFTANPSCKVDVVLDEATGDIIKGEGDGLLKIRVGNKEPLSINGRYDITKGEYTFNFQTFLKKYFTVNSGSLVWDGDPYKAKIDIIAEYLATNVNFKSLTNSASAGLGGNSFNQKSNLRVVAHLTETLLKPAIDFELQLPAGSPITDFLVLKKLEQFKQDKNELNKQITSLLLFNSFINTDQGFITASGGYSVLSNTIGGVVSSAISGFFNNLLQKYVKNLSFNFDVNSSLDNLQANVEKLQAAARSNFVYTLLNGRLIISAGLNLDYNNPYANINRNSNVLITPDITVEWILTKSGRLRVVGFNRTNYDLVGQRNRTGINLSYRRDFEKLPGIFATILFGENRNRKEKEK
ncbi:MAG: translocation/assembly module TamB domain-containing protein [Chitinophagaceae bacterium]|nr:translocation/assembly module TamB domain-containing protein [Chitinophagaceae bacterium]